VKNRNDVDEFMTALQHPLKAEIEAIRAIILSADPGISELIKWNAPSFYFKDDFATFNLRRKDSVQVIFHKGARVKDDSTEGTTISDPSGMLKWVAKERAVVTFSTMKEIRSAESALADIVRQWIKQM
jgi:hypothetical protein